MNIGFYANIVSQALDSRCLDGCIWIELKYQFDTTVAERYHKYFATWQISSHLAMRRAAGTKAAVLVVICTSFGSAFESLISLHNDALSVKGRY